MAKNRIRYITPDIVSNYKKYKEVVGRGMCYHPRTHIYIIDSIYDGCKLCGGAWVTKERL